MPLESIRSLVDEDLKSTDRFIITQLQSNIPMIKDIIKYVLSCGGKRIRPMILLLSARALNHQSGQHIDLAAVIELIHTATLLHDDVVDSSTLRRGHKTAHIIWGSDASVLVGDYLYSRAFQTVVDLKNEPVLDVFAKATHYIAEGEILQLVNCHNPDTDENFYFEIIQRKTAKLFEIAALLGATLSTQDSAQIEALKNYGNHIGLAYQLIDDVLDYNQSSDKTGKDVGQDIADGKATLPFIHALKMSEGYEKKLLRDTIESGSIKNLPKILEIVESTGAIKYTADAAKHHAAKAIEALSVIDPSPHRQALEDLGNFVVRRTY